MAAFFIDLDGTILAQKTQEPLDGAIEFLRVLKDKGNQIVFTTARCKEDWPNPSHDYSEEMTLNTLKRLGIDYDHILWGLHSPRVVINDRGSVAFNVDFNDPDFAPILAALKNL